jgi:hypothetical protein
LEPTELDAARRAGLVSTTTSRATLIAFRKQLAGPVLAQVDVAALRAEMRRIDGRLERLAEEQQMLTNRRAEIARVLSAEAP